MYWSVKTNNCQIVLLFVIKLRMCLNPCRNQTASIIIWVQNGSMDNRLKKYTWLQWQYLIYCFYQPSIQLVNMLVDGGLEIPYTFMVLISTALKLNPSSLSSSVTGCTMLDLSKYLGQLLPSSLHFVTELFLMRSCNLKISWRVN